MGEAKRKGAERRFTASDVPEISIDITFPSGLVGYATFEERMSPIDRAALELTHKLANDGRLIEAGFAAYVAVNRDSIGFHALPALRDAYMSAAEHLWSSIMATLDAGDDAMPSDLRRMEAIQAELDAWRKAKMGALAETMSTKGSA